MPPPPPAAKKAAKSGRARRGTAPALILEAARELFADRGYGAATTRSIADKAGVSEDLIFRYYGSKSGLLKAAVLTPLVESVSDLQRLWADEAALHDHTDDELIRWFVEGIYVLMENNRTIGRAMSQLLTEGNSDPEFEKLRESFGLLFDPLLASFTDQVSARGFRSGEIELQLRITMITIASVAIFLPETYRGVVAPSREAVIAELAAGILTGLTKLPNKSNI